MLFPATGRGPKHIPQDIECHLRYRSQVIDDSHGFFFDGNIDVTIWEETTN